MLPSSSLESFKTAAGEWCKGGRAQTRTPSSLRETRVLLCWRLQVLDADARIFLFEGFLTPGVFDYGQQCSSSSSSWAHNQLTAVGCWQGSNHL